MLEELSSPESGRLSHFEKRQDSAEGSFPEVASFFRYVIPSQRILRCALFV